MAISSPHPRGGWSVPLEIRSCGVLDCGCGWRTRCEREEKGKPTFWVLVLCCCCALLLLLLLQKEWWMDILIYRVNLMFNLWMGGGRDAVLGNSTLESDLVTVAIAHLSSSPSPSSCSSSFLFLLPSGVGQSCSSNHWTVGCSSSSSSSCCCCCILLFSSQSSRVLLLLFTSFLHFCFNL